MFEKFAPHIGIALACLVSGFYTGFNFERDRFHAYKQNVEIVSAAQEAHTKEVIEKQKRVADETKNDYNRRITDIRRYYVGLLNDDSRPLPATPSTPAGVDARTAYVVLAGQCAVSTQQLVSLQSFIRNTRE